MVKLYDLCTAMPATEVDLAGDSADNRYVDVGPVLGAGKLSVDTPQRSDSRDADLGGTANCSLQFALAIAKPGSLARLINSDNQLTGLCSIGEAVLSGSAYAVEVDDDVLAVDADSSDTAQYLEGKLKVELEHYNIAPVLVASGRPGNCHLLARIAEERTRRAFLALARSAGCDVRRMISPPLAPHRLGLPTQILFPLAVEQAIRRLESRKVISNQSVNLRGSRRLSARAFDLVRNGDEQGLYTSRSELLQAVLSSGVNAGLPEESLWKMLTEPKNKASEKLLDIWHGKGESAARRWFDCSYVKARRFVAEHPPFRTNYDVTRAIDEFECAIDLPLNQHWFAGRTGATDRAVIQGFIGAARRCGSVEFDLALRQLSQHSGVANLKSLRASLGRLSKAGPVAVIRRPKATIIGRYRLRSFGTQSTSIRGCEKNAVSSFASPDHDAWYGRKSLWRIWRLLEGLTINDIAARTNLGPRSVQQHVKQLREWGLATRDDHRRYHRVERNEILQYVAKLRGTGGNMASLRNRHQAERERWEWQKRRIRCERVELVRDTPTIPGTEEPHRFV
jgi:hypothetical protein